MKGKKNEGKDKTRVKLKGKLLSFPVQRHKKQV